MTHTNPTDAFRTALETTRVQSEQVVLDYRQYTSCSQITRHVIPFDPKKKFKKNNETLEMHNHIIDIIQTHHASLTCQR